MRQDNRSDEAAAAKAAAARRRLLRRLARAALAAGLVGGLLLGVGGRIAMRIIAVAAPIVPGFSLGGTLEVLATGWLIGIPAVLVLAAVRGFVPLQPVLRGALFGALVFGLLVLVPPPAARSAVAGVGGHLIPLTLFLFGPLFIAFGIVADLVMERMMERGRPAGAAT